MRERRSLPLWPPSEQPSNKEHLHESIRTREVINAPAHYVSVYHETQPDHLDSIDQYGLQFDVETTNFMNSPDTHEGVLGDLNAVLADIRPEWAQRLHLDRRQVIYGYLDLETGHGMGGYADEAFSDRKHESTFDTMQRFMPEDLKEAGVSSWQEWKNHVVSGIQNSDQAGAILELKVDPTSSYVGNLRIIEEARYPMSKEQRQQRLMRYWDTMISLKDLQEWYRIPDEDEDQNTDLVDPTAFKGFAKLKGAPDHFPNVIEEPEVLITEDVPQEHLRLVA